MTTICFDGKTLAADGRMTAHGVIITDKAIKLHTLNNIEYYGDVLYVMAMAGNVTDAAMIVNFLQDESVSKSLELYHDVSAIIVGKQYVYELEPKAKGLIKYHKNTQLSVGSGCMFALSAMRLGMNAVDAVKHAIKNDCYSGGKIETWNA